MSEAINNVKQAFDAELAQTDLTNQEAVNNLRVKYLGKKGAVTDLMKQMGTLSAEERPAYGKLVNELKVAVSEAIDKAIETANQAALQKKLESGFVDVSLPGSGIPAGSTHPLYDVREEMSILGTVAVFTAILSACGIGSGPLTHLLTGGVMLGAIFMATDYVTSPMTAWGKIIFGVGIGIIVVVIRTWGSYPEGMSFAILIMNACVPLLNRIAPKRFGEVVKK